MRTPLEIYAQRLAAAAALALSWMAGDKLPPEDVQRDLAVNMARVRNLLGQPHD